MFARKHKVRWLTTAYRQPDPLPNSAKICPIKPNHLSGGLHKTLILPVKDFKGGVLLRAGILLCFPLLDQVILGQVCVKDDVPVGVAGMIGDNAVPIVEILGLINPFILSIPIRKGIWHTDNIELHHQGCIAERHVSRKVMPTDSNRTHPLPRIGVLIVEYFDNVFEVATIIETAIGAPFIHVVKPECMHEFLTDFYN